MKCLPSINLQPTSQPHFHAQVTIQPIGLSSLSDLSGASARAAALSVYSKLRRSPSALGSCHLRGQETLLACSTGCAPLAAEPLMVLSDQATPSTDASPLPPDNLGADGDGPRGPSSRNLYCSYCWRPSPFTDAALQCEGAADDPGTVHGVNWLSMAWTDSSGEILEAQVVACPHGGSYPGGAAGKMVNRTFQVTSAIVSRVLSASLAIQEAGRRAGSGPTGTLSPDGGSGERAGGRYSRIVITKAGYMTCGEAAAWRVLLHGAERAVSEQRSVGVDLSATATTDVIVSSLDNVSQHHGEQSLLYVPHSFPCIPYVCAMRPSSKELSEDFPSRDPAALPDGTSRKAVIHFPGALGSASLSPYLPSALKGLIRLNLSLHLSYALSQPQNSGDDGEQRDKRRRLHREAHQTLPTPPLAPEEISAAEEILRLSMLNSALFSLWSTSSGLIGCRSVGIEGDGHCRLSMPLHCCVADSLLKLCTASEHALNDSGLH